MGGRVGAPGRVSARVEAKASSAGATGAARATRAVPAPEQSPVLPAPPPPPPARVHAPPNAGLAQMHAALRPGAKASPSRVAPAPTVGTAADPKLVQVVIAHLRDGRVEVSGPAEALAAGRSRWRQSTVPVVIDPSVATVTRDPLRSLAEAARPWQQASSEVPDVLFTYARGPVDPVGYRHGAPNVNTVRVIPEDDPEVTNGALAVCVITFDGHAKTIFDVDMVINGSQIFGDLPSPHLDPNVVYDVQNMLTHELGHFFGLGESTVVDATMHMFSQPGETSKRDLDPVDIQGIRQLYPERAWTQQVLDWLSSFWP